MSTNDSNPSIPDELLSAYLDGELSASEQASVEARLADDPAAREMVEELRAVSQAVRELPRQGADAGLQRAVLQRVRRQAQVSPRQSNEAEYTVGRSKRGWIWAVAAIAAALLVMVYQGQFGPEGRFQEVAHQADQSHSSPPEPESKSTPGFVNAPSPIAQDGGGVGGAADAAFSEPLAEVPAEALSSERKIETPALVPSSGFLADESTKMRRNWAASAKPIVVQLSMPVESRRNRALENVLAQQQIFSDKIASEADESESLLAVGSQVEQEYRKDYPEVEIVSVEAPRRDIVSCLAAIEKDTQNFLLVEVQELLQEPPTAESLADAGLADREKSVEKPVGRWQQFNRSGPVPQQQVSKQWALSNDVQQNLQSPANRFRQLQKRKSGLTERSSAPTNENWQQVFFVIGSEQSTEVPPAKKASVN